MIAAFLRWREARHRKTTLAYIARRGRRPTNNAKEARRG